MRYYFNFLLKGPLSSTYSRRCRPKLVFNLFCAIPLKYHFGKKKSRFEDLLITLFVHCLNKILKKKCVGLRLKCVDIDQIYTTNFVAGIYWRGLGSFDA